MLKDLMKQAYNAMQHDRNRTALTILGMAWGIATVVLLLAYGAGFGRAINNIFSTFGTKIIGVFPGRTSVGAGGSKAGVPIRLELEDVERLHNGVPLARNISPEASKQGNVQYEERTLQLPIDGLYASVQKIRSLDIDYGRFYTADDNNSRARVAVISSEAKTKLFSGQFPLDQSIRIDGVSFTVIGVLKAKMQEGDNDINRQIYIPFTTMGDLKNTRYLDGIWMDYEGMDHLKVEKMTRETLAVAHQFNPTDRRAVHIFNAMKKPLPAFAELVKMRGEASKGQTVFMKAGTCANCHIVNGAGKEVGPNLSEIGKKLSREAILESILFPSAGISHNYETYVLETKAGGLETGLLVSDTLDGVTLKGADGITRTFKRDAIESLRQSPISLMPADLHKALTPQDLADLVDYLLTLREARTSAAAPLGQAPAQKR